MTKFSLLVTAIVLSAQASMGATCGEQARLIQSDLDLILNGADSSAAETRELESVANVARQIANQLDVSPVDLNGAVNGDVERLKEQVLRAREALYNVNVLLVEIAKHNESSAHIRAVANNAIDNNLNPARSRLDSAQGGLDSFQGKVGNLHSKIQQSLKPVQNASNSLSRLAGNLSTSSSRILSLSNRAITDTRRADRRVDDMVQICQGR